MPYLTTMPGELCRIVHRAFRRSLFVDPRRAFRICVLFATLLGLCTSVNADVALVADLWTSIFGLDAEGGLIKGSDGAYYGVVTRGGLSTTTSPESMLGAVYKVTPDGSVTILHQFTGQSGDGQLPYGDLVQAGDGHLYGMAFGGPATIDTPCGPGIVYRITLAGEFSIVHQFAPYDQSLDMYPEGRVQAGHGICQAAPSAGPVLGGDGHLYGVTASGGKGWLGTIFRLSTAGEFFTITHMADHTTSDGLFYMNPRGLTPGSDGVLYGVADAGGLFRLTLAGALTQLYPFQPEDDGSAFAPPVEGTDGNFYGVNYANTSCGFFYRVSPMGEYTRLSQLASDEFGNCIEGGGVRTTLRLGSDGNFYGVAAVGGALQFGYGTVFRITPQGEVTRLHAFDGAPGQTPYGRLLEIRPGTFWGTTSSYSTVYEVQADASPRIPVAAADGYSTLEDVALSIAAPSLLMNDTYASATPSVTLDSAPAHGTLSLNANGSFTYLPTSNYNGSDSFTYKLVDGGLESAPAVVTLAVHPVNDAPIASNDSATISRKAGPFTINVLANDTDIDNDGLTIVLATPKTSEGGTLSTNGTSVVYTPKRGFKGVDAFTYRASDGDTSSNSAAVVITVLKH